MGYLSGFYRRKYRAFKLHLIDIYGTLKKHVQCICRAFTVFDKIESVAEAQFIGG